MPRPTNGAAPVVVSLLAVLTACIQGTGPVVVDRREVRAFSRIEVGAGIHVTVRLGPAAPILVHAQANIQDRITTGVRNGTLRIEATGNFTVADAVVVDVVIPALDGASLNGGAAIEVGNLDAIAVELSLSGGASARVSGTVGSLALTATGGSVATLGALEAEKVSVSLDGGSMAEVRASGSVTGTAWGGARLTVAGEASVEVEASGGAHVTGA